MQFDFVDVTGNSNSVLEHSIQLFQLLSIGDCYSKDKFKKMITLTTQNRKREGENLCY